MLAALGCDVERAGEAVVDGQAVEQEVAHAVGFEGLFVIVGNGVLCFDGGLNPVEENIRSCARLFELLVRRRVDLV